MPRSARAGTSGIVPPERRRSGRRPTTRSNASRPRRTAGASGGIRPAGALETALDLELCARRGCVAEEPLERGADLVGVLARGEPDRDVRLGEDRQHRLLEDGLAAGEPVHVDRGAREGAVVEGLGGLVVHRPRARLAEHDRAGLELGPRVDLLLRRRDDARPQLVGHGHDRLERLHERVDGVHGSAAEDARVQVALPCPEAHVEVGQAPHAEIERGRVLAGHAAVEDDAGVGSPLVGGEEVDDRVAADLLLPVEGDAHVDRQRALVREQAGRLEGEIGVALVVDGAARVQVAVADLGLERVGLPEVERRRAAGRRSGRRGARSAPRRRPRRRGSPPPRADARPCRRARPRRLPRGRTRTPTRRRGGRRLRAPRPRSRSGCGATLRARRARRGRAGRSSTRESTVPPTVSRAWGRILH